MEWTIILMRTGSIILAAAAGWLLGRSAPSWRMDRMNENMPRSYGGYGGDESGCVYVSGFFQGAWGAAALGIAAIALGIFSWQDPVFTDFEMIEETYGFELLLSRTFWVLIGSALIGYILSRLMDKGPVGPLE